MGLVQSQKQTSYLELFYKVAMVIAKFPARILGPRAIEAVLSGIFSVSYKVSEQHQEDLLLEKV